MIPFIRINTAINAASPASLVHHYPQMVGVYKFLLLIIKAFGQRQFPKRRAFHHPAHVHALHLASYILQIARVTIVKHLVNDGGGIAQLF